MLSLRRGVEGRADRATDIRRCGATFSALNPTGTGGSCMFGGAMFGGVANFGRREIRCARVEGGASSDALDDIALTNPMEERCALMEPERLLPLKVPSSRTHSGGEKELIRLPMDSIMTIAWSSECVSLLTFDWAHFFCVLGDVGRCTGSVCLLG